MAKKKPCPDFEPTQKGGAAPRCKAQHICEDFCFKLKCDPTGAVNAGLHEYDIDDKCRKTNETWKDAQGNAIDLPSVIRVDCVVSEPIVPKDPITLNGQDCAGAALPATGNPGELVQVVQAPGQVLTVRICEDDRDFELSCGVDPATGHQIQTAYKIVGGQFQLIRRWDVVTGAEWTGDPATLEGCGGKTLESEKELMCDNGTEFFRWFVIEDGEPTGAYVDTNLNGAPYTVTGTPKVGACVPVVVCAPSISSAPADTLSGLLPGHSISIQKNNCCAIRVTTSAGSFIVSKDVTGYSTGDFDCPVTVTGVTVLSGTCTLADIIVTTQTKG
jgi:hypothetical protein